MKTASGRFDLHAATFKEKDVPIKKELKLFNIWKMLTLASSAAVA